MTVQITTEMSDQVEYAEALQLLRAGDVLIRTHLDSQVEWRFARDRRVCPPGHVDTLQLGGPLLERETGRLVPQQDCLLADKPWLSQTWAWAEGGVQ